MPFILYVYLLLFIKLGLSKINAIKLLGTRFLRPRGTSPLKGVNPAGTPGYRNGTESFGLKGRPSVVRDV